MTEARLKAEIWIRAQIRMCDQALLPAVIRRKGDPDAGAILIKLDRLDGTCFVLSQVRDMEGRLTWMRATGEDPAPDMDGEAYIARQLKFDPDIWVLEIEDPAGRFEISGNAF
ncbi:MAG: DUF1491 family protein [Rhodospirillaceae bacterium]|nr:DUF1491 family protein [Rhodospirillaceae bacterium]